MIDPAKYGTASEVAEAVGVARTTLINAANRGEINSVKTLGGTLLLSLQSAIRWTKKERRPGRKPQTKTG
jgi:predicted site-specific integrase-resolvase